MEYKILEEESRSDLVDEVTAAIEDGWTPLGGVSAYSVVRESLHSGQQIDFYYVQAMVKQPPLPWNLPAMAVEAVVN